MGIVVVEQTNAGRGAQSVLFPCAARFLDVHPIRTVRVHPFALPLLPCPCRSARMSRV
jgi:hypothetical protein